MKLDSQNESVLRDLMQLQVHLRDFAGFEDTSRKMLLTKPGVRVNWVTLAAACFANRNYEGCLQSIFSIIKFHEEDQNNKMKPNELSEIILLGVRAYEGQGKNHDALAFFSKYEARVVDLVAKADYLGRLHKKLGNTEKAVAAYEELLQLNSANLETYYKVIDAKGIVLPSRESGAELSPADQDRLKAVLDEYVQGMPRVNAHLRVGLRYLSGEHFSAYLARYIRPLLIKGVPSLLQDMREFYSNADKVARIDAYLRTALSSMESEMTLAAGEEEEQDPTVMLWLYYFLGQHCLFQNKLAEALAFVDKAIAHTPTLLELYTLKGKIYQKGGDRAKAAQLHEEARALDLADRAINAISAMYILKTGDVERGTSVMDIFVKDCGYEVSIHDN